MPMKLLRAHRPVAVRRSHADGFLLPRDAAPVRQWGRLVCVAVRRDATVLPERGPRYARLATSRRAATLHPSVCRRYLTTALDGLRERKAERQASCPITKRVQQIEFLVQALQFDPRRELKRYAQQRPTRSSPAVIARRHQRIHRLRRCCVDVADQQVHSVAGRRFHAYVYGIVIVRCARSPMRSARLKSRGIEKRRCGTRRCTLVRCRISAQALSMGYARADGRCRVATSRFSGARALSVLR